MASVQLAMINHERDPGVQSDEGTDAYEAMGSISESMWNNFIIH